MTAIPQGTLIVSCQARADNPLHGPQFMGAMAQAAAEGGAGAIRANGAADVAAVRAANLPVVGINKVFSERFDVYITPNFAAAREIAEAGCDIIALDCTRRERDGATVNELIRRIREELGKPVFADVSDLDEGLAAEQMGADYVATTLSGYTGGPKPLAPDLDLVERLARACRVPVVAEGRYNTPDLARAALDAGAHAVVVGTMITNPREITRHFAETLGRAP